MVTRTMIHNEVEKVPENELEALYELVRNFSQPKKEKKRSLMSLLREIQFDGPVDMASNHDYYVLEE